MLLRDDLHHQTGDARSDIDRRIVVLRSQCSRQDDMSVQNASHSIGDRLVGIIALDEDGVNACDRSLLEISTPLEELGEF